MKLKKEIELLINILKGYDKGIDNHFPTDESQVPTSTKTQYMNLSIMAQEATEMYERCSHFKESGKKALEILVKNLNEHHHTVSKIMYDTNFVNWTKAEDKHYTNIFCCKLHKTIEETLEEMAEVK